MITFNRYPHINDLVSHYISALKREDIAQIMSDDIKSEEDAAVFSRFIWQMVEAINEDEENNVVVLDSLDNTEMLPDVSYEITKLMKSIGYYSVWESISKDEMA